MAEKTRSELKAFFETNDQPTQSEFSDFIDSILNFQDDGFGKWIKYTLDYTDFQPNATSTGYAVVLTAPALSNIVGFQMKHSASFTGGSISASDIALWLGSGTSQLSVNLDVFSAPAENNGVQNIAQHEIVLDIASTDGITLGLTLTDDIIDNLTAGSIDVWLKIDTLPA